MFMSSYYLLIPPTRKCDYAPVCYINNENNALRNYATNFLNTIL